MNRGSQGHNSAIPREELLHHDPRRSVSAVATTELLFLLITNLSQSG